MADKTVYVDGTTGGGHYATLAAAIAGEVAANPDLTTLAGILNIEISLVSAADTAAVAITGFTNPTASYYLNIYTTANARNAGGPWDATKYQLITSTSATRALLISVSYTRVTGLQIGSTYTGTGSNPFATSGGATNVLLDQCRLVCASATAGLAGSVVQLYSGSYSRLTLRNCVIYGQTHGYGIACTSGCYAVVENCTVYVPNAVNAYYARGTNTVTNTYLGGPADTIDGTLTTATKVATSDASGSEAGLRNIAASVSEGAYFTNLTAGSEDFRIVASSGLVDVGADMSGTYTTDLAGATRDATFDIGAFEYVATSQFSRPTSDVALGNWVNEASATANLYASIDETAAALSDTDYIQSGAAPTDDTYTAAVTGIVNPGAGTTIMRIRARTL